MLFQLPYFFYCSIVVRYINFFIFKIYYIIEKFLNFIIFQYFSYKIYKLPNLKYFVKISTN